MSLTGIDGLLRSVVAKKIVDSAIFDDLGHV